MDKTTLTRTISKVTVDEMHRSYLPGRVGVVATTRKDVIRCGGRERNILAIKESLGPVSYKEGVRIDPKKRRP